jgi:hypothetical protein
MALEGANIMGQAQVYNQTQNAVNTYAKTLAQQQAKRDKETKLIQDELAKMNPAGLRQQDVPGFLEQVQKWRDAATEALTEKDRTKRIIAAQNAEREKMLAFAYQQESKDEKKKDEIFYSKGLDPNWRDELQDGAYETLISGRKLPIRDPNFRRDIDDLVFQPDVSKFLKKLDDIDSQLFKTGAVVVPGQEQGERMGVQGVYEFDRRIIEPQAQSMRYAMEIDTDKNFYKALKQLYPDLAELPKEEFKNKVVPRLIQDRPKEQIGDKKFYDPRAAMNAERRLQLAEQRAADNEMGDGSIKVVEKKFTGTKLPLIDKKTGKPIVSRTGKPKLGGSMVTADFPVYATVNPPSFQMPQLTTAFNIDKAINERLNTDDAVNLTGIGYVLSKGGKYVLKATVKVKGDEHIVNLTDLPADVLNDKNYKKALKAVQNEWALSGGQPKKYTAAEEKLISDNLEANPAYTREEIIKALGL